MNKKCFKCGVEKSLDEFYLHPRMSDGHLNKCKSCTKKDVENRYYDPKKREMIFNYEIKRGQQPERKKKRLEYQRKMRLKHPKKYKARTAVSNALRGGKLKKTPCMVCAEEKVNAHHEDYDKPLEVLWLCRKHHMMWEGKIPV